MTESTLTNKQSYFLNRLREAEKAGLTIVQLAAQENVSAALLYNYRHVLRQKGHLAPAQSARSGRTGSKPAAPAFDTLALSPLSDESSKLIELKTQLANGLEPYHYLKQVFEKLPLASSDGDIDALLPWNTELISA